ncbi:MAG: hypothetical protein P4L40_14335, partial [Terracidiphilus sp.]|nr:hypothetical protein [Terracidiphilus sp.]
MSVGVAYAVTFTRVYVGDARIARWAGTVLLTPGPAVSVSVSSASGAPLPPGALVDVKDSIIISAGTVGDVYNTTWSCPGCDVRLQVALLAAGQACVSSPFRLLSPSVLKIAPYAITPDDTVTLQYNVIGGGGTTVLSLPITFKPSVSSCVLQAANSADSLTLTLTGCAVMGSFRFGVVAAGQAITTGLWLTNLTSVPSVTLPPLPQGAWVVYCTLSSLTLSSNTVNATVSVQSQGNTDPSVLASGFSDSLLRGDIGTTLVQYLSWSVGVGANSALSSSAASTARQSVLTQLSAVQLLLGASPAGNEWTLAALASAVAYPSQVSSSASVTISTASALLAPSLSYSGLHTLVTATSSLAQSQAYAVTNSQSSYGTFVLSSALPLVLRAAGLHAASFLPGEALGSALTSTQFSVSVAAVGVSSAYTGDPGTAAVSLRCVAPPTGLSVGTSAVSVTVPAGAGAAYAGSVTGNSVGFAVVYHAVNPYANNTAVWLPEAAVPVSPLVSTRAVAGNGTVLPSLSLPAPIIITLPLLSALSATSTSFPACMTYNGLTASMTRVGCVTDASQAGSGVVTCYCNSTGDVVVGMAPGPAVTLVQLPSNTPLSQLTV